MQCYHLGLRANHSQILPANVHDNERFCKAVAVGIRRTSSERRLFYWAVLPMQGASITGRKASSRQVERSDLPSELLPLDKVRSFNNRRILQLFRRKIILVGHGIRFPAASPSSSGGSANPVSAAAYRCLTMHPVTGAASAQRDYFTPILVCSFLNRLTRLLFSSAPVCSGTSFLQKRLSCLACCLARLQKVHEIQKLLRCWNCQLRILVQDRSKFRPDQIISSHIEVSQTKPDQLRYRRGGCQSGFGYAEDLTMKLISTRNSFNNKCRHDSLRKTDWAGCHFIASFRGLSGLATLVIGWYQGIALECQ